MHHPLANKQRQHPRLLLDTGTDRSGQQHLLLWQQSSQEKRKYRTMQQSAWLLQTRPSWPKSLFGPLPWQKEIHAFIHANKQNLCRFLHIFATCRSHKQLARNASCRWLPRQSAKAHDFFQGRPVFSNTRSQRWLSKKCRNIRATWEC